MARSRLLAPSPRRFRWITLAALGLLLGGLAALAAPSAQGRRSVSPPGAGPAPFIQLPGQSVTYPTSATHGPYGVAVSPDGKNVYAADYGNDRLVVFTRDPNTGALTENSPPQAAPL